MLTSDRSTSNTISLDYVRGGMSDGSGPLRILKANLYIQIGAKALKGEDEYIDVNLFEAVNYDRRIHGKGMSIMIYDPKADMNTPPYWEHNDTSKSDSHDVPAGYKVRVIGATVKFTLE